MGGARSPNSAVAYPANGRLPPGAEDVLQSKPSRAGCQRQQLQVCGRRAEMGAPALVQCLARRAPDLAAGGLEHGVRRGEHHFIRRFADGVDHGPRHRFAQPRRGGRGAGPGLRQHNQAFRAGGGIGTAEHRHATPADALHTPHRILDLLRVEVAPAANDDVLHPAGDVDVARGRIGAVTGVQPAVVEQLRGFLRIAEVAARRRWAAELQPALHALAELAALRIDDADLMARPRVCRSRRSAERSGHRQRRAARGLPG